MKPVAARAAPQHKARVVRRTKAPKRAPANQQTSQKNVMYCPVPTGIDSN